MRHYDDIIHRLCFDLLKEVYLNFIKEKKPAPKNRYYVRRIWGCPERGLDALSVTGKDISFQNGLYVHVWNGMSLNRSKPCLFCRSGTALNRRSETSLNCRSETMFNCHSETMANCYFETMVNGHFKNDLYS